MISFNCTLQDADTTHTHCAILRIDCMLLIVTYHIHLHTAANQLNTADNFLILCIFKIYNHVLEKKNYIKRFSFFNKFLLLFIVYTIFFFNDKRLIIVYTL